MTEGEGRDIRSFVAHGTLSEKRGSSSFDRSGAKKKTDITYDSHICIKEEFPSTHSHHTQNRETVMLTAVKVYA